MNEKTKLILAMQQIENLTELFKDNPYERFLSSHLISIKVEVSRQMQLIEL